MPFDFNPKSNLCSLWTVIWISDHFLPKKVTDCSFKLTFILLNRVLGILLPVKFPLIIDIFIEYEMTHHALCVCVGRMLRTSGSQLDAFSYCNTLWTFMSVSISSLVFFDLVSVSPWLCHIFQVFLVNYPHLLTPFKLHSVLCFFVRSHLCVRVFAAFLCCSTLMWIIKDYLSFFFFFFVRSLLHDTVTITELFGQLS